MKPIDFPQRNVVYADYGKGQPEYLPLPSFLNTDPASGFAVTACWGMTWRERLRALWTGRIYVTILTFGAPLAPSRVSTEFKP